MKVLKSNGEIVRYDRQRVQVGIKNMVSMTGKFSPLEAYAWSNALIDVVHGKCRKIGWYGKPIPAEQIREIIKEELIAHRIININEEVVE